MVYMSEINTLSIYEILYNLGATEGLQNSACSGLCAPGYYCPERSTSRTQYNCGDLFHGNNDLTTLIDTVSSMFNISESFGTSRLQNSVFCPEGSSAPLPVQVGFYSIGFNRSTRY